MPEVADLTTQNTPLAPSVEKAYYRKCIQLKRRLNEVEAANDEARIRRLRLERGIMKMRLERAFLLDELRKRMEQNVDNSEGSADEGMATPPPERPHRDKRRRQTGNAQDETSAAQQSGQHEGRSSRRTTLQGESVAQDGIDDTADVMDGDNSQQQHSRHRSRSSQYGRDRRTNGLSLDGAAGDEMRGINREGGATGDALSAGPALVEDSKGERRLVSSESADAGEAGYASVNQ